MTLKFEIKGIPSPKQSARFRTVTVGEKSFIQSYQKAKVVHAERNIAYDVKSQLPAGFRPIMNQGIAVKVTFVFPPLSSFPKKKIQAINAGYKFYKITKPDLVDNLMKLLFDAMNGIVYVDDALVCKTETEKYYGSVPMTVIEMTTEF